MSSRALGPDGPRRPRPICAKLARKRRRTRPRAVHTFMVSPKESLGGPDLSSALREPSRDGDPFLRIKVSVKAMLSEGQGLRKVLDLGEPG